MRLLNLAVSFLISLSLFIVMSPSQADVPSASAVIPWQAYSDSIFVSLPKDRNLILVYARADWCEWCKKFSSTALKDPRVIEMINKNYSPVMMDIDRAKDAAIQYKITELPTLLILDKSRHVIHESHG